MRSDHAFLLAVTKLGAENPEIQSQGYGVPHDEGKRVNQHAVDDPKRNADSECDDGEQREIARRPSAPRTQNLRHERGGGEKARQKTNRL